MSKKTNKGSAVSFRLPEKTRYGLELAARKQAATVSDVVQKALDDFICTIDIPGMTLNRALDCIWSDSESDRIKLLGEHAPMLMTPAEKVELSILNAIDACVCGNLLEYLHDHGLLLELLAPGISDTFADDVLNDRHDCKSTSDLKSEAIKFMQDESNGK